MKTILCYGDSNTHGYNPNDGERFSYTQRWTGILSKLLGNDYLLIEEGLNGRTINFTDPQEPWKNGYTTLKPILASHKPLDIVVVMLGTNDLKHFFKRSMEDINKGMEDTVKTIKSFLNEKQGYEPKVILCSPIPLDDNVVNSCFAYEMNEESINKSKQFSKCFKEIAEKENCIFFDANTMFKASPIDCMHMDEDTHYKFANELYKTIKANI